MLIPNMMFICGANVFKTPNTQPITLGGIVGNRGFRVGKMVKNRDLGQQEMQKMASYTCGGSLRTGIRAVKI